MKTRPIFPLLLSMSLPMVISMLVNSLYNIIDSFFVAKISEDAMTVVVPGRAEPATLPVADSPFTALKLENGWVETPGAVCLPPAALTGPMRWVFPAWSCRASRTATFW